MKIFHRHTLEEQSRRFSSPLNRPNRVEGHNDETLKMLTFGVTVVVLECTTCHDLVQRQFVGDQT